MEIINHPILIPRTTEELISTPIEGIAFKELGLATIYIYPINDIQYGVPQCRVNALKQYIKQGIDRNAYFVGLGDFVDFNSPGERQALQSAKLHDVTRLTLEEAAMAKIEELEEEVLEHTRGRWLGFLVGHHWARFEDGTTSDMRLANYLKAKFLGHCALSVLSFKAQTKSHRQAMLTLWLHHGSGSGTVTSFSQLLKLERMVIGFEADIYLVGHKPTAPASNIARVYPMGDSRGIRLEVKKRVLAGCGGWVESYQQGSKNAAGYPWGHYGEQRQYQPTLIGSNIIRLEVSQNNAGRVHVIPFIEDAMVP